MANPQNKQNKQSDSEKSGQNNQSEFGTTPSSSANAGGSSRGDSSTSTETGGGSMGSGTSGGATGAGIGGSGTGASGAGSTAGTTGAIGGGSGISGASSTSSASGGTGGSMGTPSGGASGSGGGTGAATATARSLMDQAKETAGQAYDAVADKAVTKLDEQKSTLSSGLTTVADSIRQASQNLGSSPGESGLAETAARYTDTAAEKIEEVATYFKSQNVREMARDLESFARRNPAVFLGAAFGLGILAARFLKSTPSSFDQTGANRGLAAAAGADRQLTSTSSTKSEGDKLNPSRDRA